MKLEEKIQGCLVGSVIGAELGFAKTVQPERFEAKKPEEIFSVRLERVSGYKEEKNRVFWRSVTPFIDLGIQAYLKKKGRVTPEDFADLFKDDPKLSGPVFAWDGIHTVQEILREGMHPRLSGLGNAPCGLIGTAMPAVGIYHFADPEYAYLDGVEIASVCQPRVGADWAALCAVAISAAFAPGANPEKIVDSVLKIAFQNNKDLCYQINPLIGDSRRYFKSRSEEEFLAWWYHFGGKVVTERKTNWTAFNPIYYVLPLLEKYAQEPQKIMALLLNPGGNAIVSPVIAGAISGALYGKDIFPGEWLEWAEPIAEPWFPMAEVARKRISGEKEIITEIRSLQETKQNKVSLLEDKIHGCILAGAIGNAMGSATEGMFYWEIDQKHPGGIKTVLNPERLEGEDDNQMAMHLVETYLKADGNPVMARQFGQRWKEYLNRDHFFPHCMGNAYDLICAGWDTRITGHWIQVTGSTVMCMEPVGIYHACDPGYAVIDATAISYMYQRGLDVTAAALLAAATAEAMKPEATVRSVCDAVLSLAPRKPLRTFDRRKFNNVHQYLETCLDIAAGYTDVFAARAELYKKCLFYHMIDPLELFGLSLAMLVISKGDVRQAAIGGTNIGRDADTIAGRAAMLAGTLHGAGSIPKDWVALFTPEALKRIEMNAGRFASLVSGKKLDSLILRQKLINR
ncbi:MAG: ADP-ribosylglycohydrolase family protein [Candidatus Omnitrophota bacterium]